jgi:predicted DNA-binding antitoxin AbrB/MazE fold protein
MSKVIEAIYENGVFKPLQKVNLREGERVKIEIKEDLSKLRGKYGKKIDLITLRDEIYDRRSHIRG